MHIWMKVLFVSASCLRFLPPPKTMSVGGLVTLNSP